MTKKHALRWLAAAAVAIAPFAASADPYSNLVIFGDSLSDGGNNATLFGTDPGQVITSNAYSAKVPYGSGTYSNGEVWGTFLGRSLGLPALPSRLGGTNFAFGGARTSNSEPPSLTKQVSYYLNTDTSQASDTLFVIAGGGNNARDALEAIAGGAPIVPTLLNASRQYAQDVGLMVDRLQAVGAQHIVVWNTPDIGLVPQVTINGPLASTLGTIVSNSLNNALARRLSSEEGVETFDLSGLVRSVVANPGDYGFENVTDACGAITTPNCNVETFLFWDGIHPTSAGQRLIADQMLALAVPEPGAVWLMLGGLGVLVLRRRQASAGAASSRATSASSL